jgi:large subunit ribosomal protein L24|tara:strand:+ start:369 stop:602 length:234 start_codon:yes stop_codon:yes gene_type:complete
MSIKKGDTVKILTGKDKGKTGKVLRSLPKMSKIIVEGVNVSKKHRKANKKDQKGQIIEKTMPIHISNIAAAKKTKKK